mmetsp:Transcript_90415/g.193850  ORF Transcript_90415/g.193850 Transcript_90415/m.193850 type:complete len:349 (+) Transcript_90415:51-1097(+)
MVSAAAEEPKLNEGWIDVQVCEGLLSKDIKFLLGVDGSEVSVNAMSYVTNALMQRDRQSIIKVVHIYDDRKDYLPPRLRRDSVASLIETQLESSVSKKRWSLRLVHKGQQRTSDLLTEQIVDFGADYACLGFVGLKGSKKDAHLMASNVFETLKMGVCSCIVIKDEEKSMLPIGRKTKFVISVGLNKASTKAFLDAVRLSKPGDELHVVYVKSYLESVESDYTTELRKKYSGFFEGLNDEQEGIFYKFHDRSFQFQILDKRRKETVPQAVVRYVDEVEADFVVVGTNSMRVQKGKTPVGSISMQICMETDRNFIVATWTDVNPRVYEAHVRRGKTPPRTPIDKPQSGL